MIRRDGRRMVVSGPVTLTNVMQVVTEGKRHLEEGAETVDLSEVTEIDSSLLAAMLAWLRDSKIRDHDLAFTNLPDALQTIARLYGVDGLLSAAPPRH